MKMEIWTEIGDFETEIAIWKKNDFEWKRLFRTKMAIWTEISQDGQNWSFSTEIYGLFLPGLK